MIMLCKWLIMCGSTKLMHKGVGGWIFYVGFALVGYRWIYYESSLLVIFPGQRVFQTLS